MVFIIVPPLFLLLYPTKVFRKCSQLLKTRWDIINSIMDIFQGWFKDGTEGTRDYRFISVFYFFLRIILGCEIMMMLSIDYQVENYWLWEIPIPGIVHIMLGAFFFAIKPYKRVHMNHVDGLIFILFDGLFFIVAYNTRPLYVIVIWQASVLYWPEGPIQDSGCHITDLLDVDIGI